MEKRYMAGQSAGQQRAGGKLGGMCQSGRNLHPEPMVCALMCSSCCNGGQWR